MPVFSLTNADDRFVSSAFPTFGNDSEVRGRNGDDAIIVDGTFGRVLLYGENGNDVIDVTAETNFRPYLSGGNGDDRLMVDGINATVEGGNGNDTIASESSTLLIPGNVLSGGPGTDTFILDNKTVLFTADDTDEVVSNGDRFGGSFDVITDYQSGEVIDIPAATRVGAVGLADYIRDEKVPVLADGEYAVFRVRQLSENTLAIDDAGPDLLVIYDELDGVDATDAVGGVVLQNAAGAGSVLIA